MIPSSSHWAKVGSGYGLQTKLLVTNPHWVNQGFERWVMVELVEWNPPTHWHSVMMSDDMGESNIDHLLMEEWPFFVPFVVAYDGLHR